MTAAGRPTRRCTGPEPRRNFCESYTSARAVRAGELGAVGRTEAAFRKTERGRIWLRRQRRIKSAYEALGITGLPAQDSLVTLR